jgi:tripartite-type tricarboxylate transporter receptor subunit TctC
MLGRGPLMIVTHKSVGVKTLPQLVAATKKRPEGLDYCSSGTGSITHLAGELFRQKSGANLTHIPYKGSGPATIDFRAGRTQVFFATFPTMLQYVKTGAVELVAVTSSTRSPLFPDVPTAMEAGISNYNISTWWGIVAPAGTPEPILAKLNAVINDAASKEPLKARLVDEGAEAYRGTPAEFRSMLSAELAMWKDVAKTSGIKLD